MMLTSDLKCYLTCKSIQHNGIERIIIYIYLLFLKFKNTNYIKPK